MIISAFKTKCPYFILFCLLVFAENSYASSLSRLEDSQSLSVEEDAKTLTDEEVEELDPLEPLNRGLYGIHFVIDGMIVAPLAYLYNDTVPDPIKDSISNFVGNLFTPLTMVNNLLTLDVEGFGDSFSRFFINTTIGLFGLFDVAAEVFDIQPNQKFFNDTLETWGVGTGPYIFLPLIGPSHLRDSVGRVGDFYGDPYNAALRWKDSEEYIWIRTGINGLDRRRQVLDITEDVYKTEDPYAQFRFLFMQNSGMIDTVSQEGPVPTDLDYDNGDARMELLEE